ncbi:MAG: GNAT family N-acetyltransferase [Inhella sp.]
MTDTAFVPADQLPAAVLHEAFSQAFSDYLIGPFQLSLAQWPGFLARQAVDLSLSRVALDAAGQPLAFAFVAPRTGRWRLATMGATPAARGSGAAPALLDDFIHRARAAGQQAVELEVFAQNERAVRLYQSRGFETVHELLGFERAASGAAAQAPGFDALPREQALQWLRTHEPADLPLQVSATVLERHPSAWTAWQTGQAQLVWTEAGERVQILSLVDLSPAQADAERLVAALAAAEPTRGLFVPQLQRMDLGGAALRRLGFESPALCQWLMRRPLQG